ncbi:threonine dehydrogenase-like Zn-dependent dehydrogenase [Paraburkholderia sp. GAS448]
MLLRSLRADRLDAALLITHRFRLDDILNAYETVAHAAETQALKVIIEV